jgi:hypothetical protein
MPSADGGITGRSEGDERKSGVSVADVLTAAILGFGVVERPSILPACLLRRAPRWEVGQRAGVVPMSVADDDLGDVPGLNSETASRSGSGTSSLFVILR